MNHKVVCAEIDQLMFFCLCAGIFYIPFTKAGIELCVWFSFFLWLLKKIIVYQGDGFSRVGLLPKTPVNVALGLYMAANILSVIFSINHGSSLNGLMGKELKFMAIFFMLVDVVNTRKRLWGIFVAFIASSVILMIDAGMQYFIGVDYIREYALQRRVRATFNTPTALAAWLIVAIPIFLSLLISTDRRLRKWKIPLLALVLTLFFCLLATYSRAAWLGLLLVLPFVCGYALKGAAPKAKRAAVSAFLLLLFVLFLLPSSVRSKIKTIGSIDLKNGQSIGLCVKSILRIEEGSWPIRLNLWTESYRIIKQQPWTGSGLNTYAEVVRRHILFDRGGQFVHNSFLQRTAETGIIGLIVFLSFLILFFQEGIRYLNKNRDFLVLGFLSGLFAFLVHSFFDNHFYSLRLVVLFWFFAGLTMAAMKVNRSAES